MYFYLLVLMKKKAISDPEISPEQINNIMMIQRSQKTITKNFDSKISI